MPSRTRLFWQQVTDGIAVQQLWSQFRSDARASYRLYSREVDWQRGETETRWQRFKRIARGLFWAMVLKLSPARRVLFIAALVLLVFPGIDVRFREAEFQTPNLAFFGALLLLILFALELADRVTMKRDLEIAKDIQGWMMPAAAPQIPGIEIAFATRPANTVAGDYYDTFFRPVVEGDDRCSNSLIVVVADVAGKSVPAALLMATLRASLRTLAGACSGLPELMLRLNRYACEQNAGGQRFTTVFLAELDLATRQLTYINAGHNWPVLRHASGATERLDKGGVPIGLLASARYESGSAQLAPGDTLLIFTDGLIEAENDREEEFGEDRMFAVFNASAGRSAKDVLRNVMAEADHFVGTAAQHDDITCLVLRETST
ncbi:MAG TPA: PP2C family protein-serine/threonine phosphatase [Bryobacteraceae bacterium]|jgi:serine phosphatase RsbU (regulator of sigma subunit)|nr:PP2C family protein-serine/threonine phosphatase [Bryobacteraceae bacterium]